MNRTLTTLFACAACSSSPTILPQVDGGVTPDGPTTTPDAAPPIDAPPPVPGITVALVGASGAVTTADFGAVDLAGRPYVRSFRLRNPGTAPLLVNSVAVTGAASDDFSVTAQPAGTVAPGGYTLFQVAFQPSASGAREAVVMIDNNAGPQGFAVRGTGGLPKVQLVGLGHAIREGAIPSLETGTDFGSAAAGAVPIVRRFVIRNQGEGALATTATVAGDPDFTVSAAPPSSVPAGSTATFAISFQRGGDGVRAATVTVATDDAAHPQYRFEVGGRGVSGTSRLIDVVTSGFAAQLPYSVLMDADSDGDRDLLVLHATSDFDPIPQDGWRNDGGGHFTDDTANLFTSAPLMTVPRHFAVIDGDGDGLLDLFVADQGHDGAPSPGAPSHLLLQTPGGQLADRSGQLPYEVAYTHDTAAGDIDGDGDLDLYQCNVAGAQQIPPRFFINDGTTHFTVDTSGLPAFLDYTQPGGRKYTSSALVDVDLDGDLDLLLGGHGGGGTTENFPRDGLLLNDGLGRFSAASDSAMPLRLGGDMSGTVGMAAGDVDNDGWPDLVMLTHVNYSHGRLQLLLNNGDGTFRDATDRLPSDAVDYTTSDGSNTWYVYAYVVDLDGDGRLDIVTVGLNIKNRVLTQQANGTFVETRTYPQVAQLSWVVPGDVDGDGVCDLVQVLSGP